MPPIVTTGESFMIKSICLSSIVNQNRNQFIFNNTLSYVIKLVNTVFAVFVEREVPLAFPMAVF
jgi:hypothetical protein